MRSNHYAYARKFRARVMKLFMRKLYNFPMKLFKRFYEGFPVIFPGKYLKNNT